VIKNNGSHDRHSPIFRRFSPGYLFSSGAPGAWYDPSDFSTLFQDSAGTTPVTAVEQPVGLILDKSQGATPGPELVTNGDFSQGITGWSAGPTTPSGWTFAGGVCSGVNAAGGYQNVGQVTSEKTYVAEFTISDFSNGALSLINSASGAFGTVFTGNGVKRQIFTAAATGTIGFIRRTTNFTGSIDNFSVKELAGNQAFQATGSSRPVLKIDGNGKYYLLFDGVDDGLSTNSINFTSTNEISVFAGIRKLSDVNPFAMVADLSAVGGVQNGSFCLMAPWDSAEQGYAFDNKGTLPSRVKVTNLPAPRTNTITALASISGDLATLRVNGAQVAQSTADAGTGTYGNYPLFIGRRNNSILPFNGNIYSLIIVGKAVTATELSLTEAWVNGKTGAYA
jgi:hypothetical protein